MKILYHHRTLSKDGQSVHIEEMIAAFRRAGHEVLVVGPAASATSSFGSDGGLLSRIRKALPFAVGEVLEFAYSFLAFARLWRAYRRFRPDVFYERYNLFLLAGVWLRALTGIPMALEVNSPLVLERRKEPGLGLVRFARWCERVAWRGADYVLPVTGVLAEHVVAVGVPRDRITVIHNGIDPAHYNLNQDGIAIRDKLGLRGKLVIGFTGFMRAWHGLPAVAEFMGQLRERGDLHFLVVGDGDARESLERTAREQGVADRVTITGVVERKAMPGYIAAFDIAMQPMATPYASPLKLFEYMAMGRAVVAPDQPNLREVLEDGANGLLFLPSEPHGLAQSLATLIANPNLRAKLGAAAARTITDRKMTWDGNAARVVALFAPR
jgi:glycosyltransferase involved in cell wall biosynthesis